MWMMQLKACESFARRVIQGWANGAQSEVFHHWKSLVEARRREMLLMEKDNLEESLYQMKRSASESMCREVINNWRNKALFTCFQSWADLVHAKHIQEMKEALDEALEDKQRLEDKVTKLQK